MKIAAIQTPPVFMNLNATLELFEELLAEVSANNAKLAVFPETWLPGYPAWLDSSPNACLWNYKPTQDMYARLKANSIVIGDNHFKKLVSTVKKYKVPVVIGIHELDGNTIYNSQLFFNESGEYNLHRKLTPTYTERLVWGSGDGSTLNPVAECEYGNVGGLICWEHWLPQLRIVMHELNEVIHVCQWPTSHEIHQIAARQYAFEASCHVVSSGCMMSKQDMIDGIKSAEMFGEELKLIEDIPGDNDTKVLFGGSCIIKPDTSFVTEPDFASRGIIYADVDLKDNDRGNLTRDIAGHYSRPDIFTLQVDRTKRENLG